MEREYIASAGLEGGSEESFSHISEAATDYDHSWVEDVYNGGEAEASEVSGPIEDLISQSISGLRSFEDCLGIDGVRSDVAHRRILIFVKAT